MKWHLILFAFFLVLTINSNSNAQQDTLDGRLEIFSWWAGDEGPALEALIQLYQQQYPLVEVVNVTVTGGAGVNFRAVLKTRMLGGNPPDTFQVHAGQELTGTWVIADRMQDLTWLYEQEGWFDVFPQGLINEMSYEDGIYAVPVNIHRAGVLWYIPENLDTWGITVPTTLEEFYAICEALQNENITPLVIGEAWTIIHLWDQVALSVLGADNYEALWRGELSASSDEMLAVWDEFGKILDCTNIAENAAGLSWQQATDSLVVGDAAFNVMGDWVAGYLTTTLGLVPDEDFAWDDFPGTQGTFTWLSDTFGLPVDAPNQNATIAWLRLIGCIEGQNVFNPLKGSIPARLDAVALAPESYNTYSQFAANEYANDRLVGSMMHGVVANERFVGDFHQVIDSYVMSRSSIAAATTMEAICMQAGACGY